MGKYYAINYNEEVLGGYIGSGDAADSYFSKSFKDYRGMFGLSEDEEFPEEVKRFSDGRHVFELTDRVPAGYEVWSIGKNMVDGFLPLCRLKAVQPFEGGRAVEVNTLKAIRLEGAQTVLAAFGFGPHDIPSMEKYIKRYSKSKTAYVMRRVDRMKKALEIMKTLKWE